MGRGWSDQKSTRGWSSRNPPGGAAGISLITDVNSYVFNGTDEYIDFGNLSALNFDYDDAHSINLFLKWGASGSFGTIASKRDNSSPFRGWAMQQHSTNEEIQYYVGHTFSTDATAVYSTDMSLSEGTWYMITMTFDGVNAAGMKLYKNGSVASLTTRFDNASTSITNTYDVTFGSNQGSFLAAGSMTFISIFDKELSTAEIAELKSGTIAPVDPRDTSVASNLLFFAPFGEGDDTLDSANGVNDLEGSATGSATNMTDAANEAADVPT